MVLTVRQKRRRLTVPRVERLEARRLLARFELLPSNPVEIDALYISSSVQFFNDHKELPLTNDPGTRSITATVPGLTASASFTHGGSSLSFSASASINSVGAYEERVNSTFISNQSGTYGSLIPVRIQPEGSEKDGDEVVVTFSGTSRATGDGYPNPYAAIFGNDEAQLGNAQAPPFSSQVDTSFQTTIGTVFYLTLHGTTGASGQPAPPSLPPLPNSTGTYQLDFELTLKSGDMTIVATKDESSGAETDFGPYLEGVPLDNTFIVTPSASLGASQVRFRIPGVLDQTKPLSAANEARFDVEMDRVAFKEGEYQVIAEALDSSGAVLKTRTGRIDIINSLAFELQARYNGGPSVPDEIEHYRFLRGIVIPGLTFTGSIASLPEYYLGLVKSVAIQSVRTGLTNVVRDAGGRVTFDFVHDPSSLPVGTTPVIFQLEGPNGSITYNDTESLKVIDVPDWVGPGPTISFASGQDVLDALGGGSNGAYAIRFKLPAGNNLLHTTTTSGTPYKVFDNLESSFELGANVIVYARPTSHPGDARAQLEDAFVEVRILGQKLLEKTVGRNEVEITAPLDPATLVPNGTILLHTTQDIQIAAGQKLFDSGFGAMLAQPIPILLPLPPILAAEFGSGAKLSFGGRFLADTGPVRARLGLALQYQGAGKPLKYVDGASVLEVSASAGVKLSAGADLSVEFSGFTIAQTSVAVGAYAHLYGNLVLTASGDVLAPTITFDRRKSQAALAVGFGARFDLQALGLGIGIEPVGDPIVVPLFGLDLPSAQRVNLTMLVNDRVKGILDAASLGFGGVKPTSGTTMGVLGSTSTPTPPAPFQPIGLPGGTSSTFATLASGTARVVALRDASLDTRTETVLPLATPIFQGVQSIHLDFNALASSGTLTPESHVLEIVLVAPDGSEVPLGSIDLAGEALASNDNPLGFAGGWRALELPVPADALEFGLPYSLEFRLLSDEAGTGERVAVAIDRVRFIYGHPTLASSSPDDDVEDGQLSMAAGQLGTLRVSNTGSLPLHLDAVTIVGAGFELVDPLPTTGTLVILPGQGYDLRVRSVDPAGSAEATLQLNSDDPEHPTRTIRLLATSGTPDPGPDPAPGPDPDPGANPEHGTETGPQPDPEPGEKPGSASPPESPTLPVDRIGPRFASLARRVAKKKVTALVLTLDKSLDPASATRLASFRLARAGKDRKLGTRDDRNVPLRAVRIDADGLRIALTPRRPLEPRVRYRLTVSGAAAGLVDRSGNRLDGDGDGLQGGDLIRDLMPRQLATSSAMSVPSGPLRSRKATR